MSKNKWNGTAQILDFVLKLVLTGKLVELQCVYPELWDTATGLGTPQHHMATPWHSTSCISNLNLFQCFKVISSHPFT